MSLAVITTEDIVSDSNSSSVRSFKVLRSGGSTDITGNLDEYDSDRCSFSCGSISGVRTLMATKCGSETLTIRVSSLVESGNAEIAVVIDGQIFGSAAANEEKEFMINNATGKEVLVKLAGESAKVQLALEREFG